MYLTIPMHPNGTTRCAWIIEPAASREIASGKLCFRWGELSVRAVIIFFHPFLELEPFLVDNACY